MTINAAIYLSMVLFWGTAFLAIKLVVAEVPPLFAASLRVAIGAVALLVYFSARRRSLRVPPAAIPWIGLSAVFMFTIPFGLIFWGEQFISAGLTGVLNGTISMWTFVIGVAFLRSQEPFSVSKLVGMLSGGLGLYLIFAPKIELSGSGSELLGGLAVLGGAVGYAVAAVLNRSMYARYGNRLTPDVSLVYQMVIGCAGLLAWSAVAEEWVLAPILTTKVAVPLIYLGVGPSALAFLGFYHLIRVWDATRATSATYFSPLLALVTDFVYDGTLPSWAEVGGTICILVGVVVMQFQWFDRHKTKA